MVVIKNKLKYKKWSFINIKGKMIKVKIKFKIKKYLNKKYLHHNNNLIHLLPSNKYFPHINNLNDQVLQSKPFLKKM